MDVSIRRRRRRFTRAFTLLEITLVVALLVIITAMVVPTFIEQIRGQEFPESGRKFRAMLTMVRANAALDGRRYRLRFPEEGERDAHGTDVQPIIEREDDPFLEPEVFTPVKAPWAMERTLLGKVWCVEVRLGRPTIDDLQARRERIAEELENALDKRKEEFTPDRPPLYVEPDGSTEWASFVLTEAPKGTSIEQLEDEPQLHVILDGDTGAAWLQRAFYQEELDLFQDKGWPAVLRQDLLTTRVLGENDVLELHEIRVKEPVE